MSGIRLLLAIVLAGGLASAGPASAADPRAWQHGVDLVPLPDGRRLLVWSSSGLPPKGPGPDGNWTHDVFVADVARLDQPIRLIARPEAQEPVSAAISADGRLMLTMEDGWQSQAEVSQRFGIYGLQLQPIAGYPRLVAEGGHSGHVAASGNRFVVVYGDGWVKGGGVDDLGSGRDVLAKVYSSDGRVLHTLTLGRGKRDWWPLVAASPSRALAIWQRFMPGRKQARLMAALIDPSTGKVIRSPRSIAEGLIYYTHAVAYLPASNSFLVTGTGPSGRGFALLMDGDGRVVDRRDDLAPTVREAWPVVNRNRVAVLTSPTGAQLLEVAGEKILPIGRYDDETPWEGIGATGEMDQASILTVYALSRQGLLVRRLTPAGGGGGS